MEVVVLSSQLEPSGHSRHVDVDQDIIVCVVLVEIESVNIRESLSVVGLTIVIQESPGSLALDSTEWVYVKVYWIFLKLSGCVDVQKSSVLEWYYKSTPDMKVKIVCFRRELLNLPYGGFRASILWLKHIAPRARREVEFTSLLCGRIRLNS